MEVPTGTTEFRPLSRPGKMRDFVSSPPEREKKKEDRNLEEDNSASSRIVREQFLLFSSSLSVTVSAYNFTGERRCSPSESGSKGKFDRVDFV